MRGELCPGKDRGVVMELLKGMGREEILEFLSSAEFCQHCEDALESRIHKLVDEKGNKTPPLSNGGSEFPAGSSSPNASCLTSSESIWESVTVKSHLQEKHNGRGTSDWSPASVKSRKSSVDHSGSEILLNEELGGASPVANNDLSEEEKERTGLAKVGRKKDFVHMERINGKSTNILHGLELHNGVFNAEEQKAIVECVYNLQRMGQKGLLKARTYSEPKKWMRGKGRVTIQFGCCYNYSVDKMGNPPGIIRDEEVDPIPPLLKQMIKRMVRWHVLPPTCIPNSCIVNIYEEGDCIPPHIDHHDFLQPFCTVSFLTECNILFGSNLKVVDAGEFSGPVSISLPCGSVLILNGNGADIAKHCVPGVPAKRISITFRKMDDSKLPYKFLPDPELQGIKPIVYSPMMKVPHQLNQHQKPLTLYSTATAPAQQNNYQNGKSTQNKSQSGSNKNTSFSIDKDDFPPLGSTNSSSRSRAKGTGLKK